MPKLIAPLAAAAVAMFATLAVTKMTPSARSTVFDGFGHYEDELVKIDVQWLFSKRRIHNENRDEWAFKSSNNPAW